jgi:uncharacterized protein (DUF433 family)
MQTPFARMGWTVYQLARSGAEGKFGLFERSLESGVCRSCVGTIDKMSVFRDDGREQKRRNVMVLPDFLFEYMPDAIRMKGRRLRLEHVLELFNEGYTPEMIVEYFDGPSLTEIQKVIGFYLDNRLEVDAYIKRVAEIEARLECEHPPSAAVLEMRRQMAERDKTCQESS